MTPAQAYDWLAPKLSTQERKALDLIYEALQPEERAIIERCAKVCEDMPMKWLEGGGIYGVPVGLPTTAEDCAKAIRALLSPQRETKP